MGKNVKTENTKKVAGNVKACNKFPRVVVAAASYLCQCFFQPRKGVLTTYLRKQKLPPKNLPSYKLKRQLSRTQNGPRAQSPTRKRERYYTPYVVIYTCINLYSATVKMPRLRKPPPLPKKLRKMLSLPPKKPPCPKAPPRPKQPQRRLRPHHHEVWISRSSTRPPHLTPPASTTHWTHSPSRADRAQTQRSSGTRNAGSRRRTLHMRSGDCQR